MRPASRCTRHFTVGLVGLLAVAVLAGAERAAAKPKPSGLSNGCTMAQIQAPSAAQCMAQLDQDVMSGAAYPHALFCDVTGVYCCQSDGTRTFGCKKVALQIQQRLTPLSPGALKSVQD